MRRRDLLPVVAVAAMAWPQIVASQNMDVPVVGFVTALAEADRLYLRPSLLKGLEEAGYVEGRDVSVEYRWAAGDFGQLPSFVQELVDLDAKVIITDSTPATLAARETAEGMPLVFLIGSDPVKRGFVESLNRPGGNLTGFLLVNTDLTAKRTALLIELFPTAKEIVLLANPLNVAFGVHENEFRKVAKASGLETRTLEASTDAEIDAAFESLGEGRDVALVVQSDQFFDSRRERLVDLATRYGVAAIYQWREFAQAGGLVSYGVSLPEAYRSLGELAGEVLSGRVPADLPVRVATKFEMVVNLERAQALGIAVAPMVLLRADEVIE